MTNLSMIRKYPRNQASALKSEEERLRAMNIIWIHMSEGHSMGYSCRQAGYYWTSPLVKQCLLSDFAFYSKYKERIIRSKKANGATAKIFNRFDSLHEGVK